MRDDMYNKIFTKILDSSIWLESDSTRIVWVTLIAAMDEDGFAQFAAVENLSRRANVALEAAQIAVEALEGPDPNSGDPENDGRRIERVPGGWVILNAQKYRQLVTRLVEKEQNRERVRRHRSKRNETTITEPLQDVTSNDSYECASVHTSDSVKERRKETQPLDVAFNAFRDAYPNARRKGGYMAQQAFVAAVEQSGGEPALMAALENHKASEQWATVKHIPGMDVWLREERWRQVLPSSEDAAKAVANAKLPAWARSATQEPDYAPWICRHLEQCGNSTTCAVKNEHPNKYPLKAEAS